MSPFRLLEIPNDSIPSHRTASSLLDTIHTMYEDSTSLSHLVIHEGECQVTRMKTRLLFVSYAGISLNACFSRTKQDLSIQATEECVTALHAPVVLHKDPHPNILWPRVYVLSTWSDPRRGTRWRSKRGRSKTRVTVHVQSVGARVLEGAGRVVAMYLFRPNIKICTHHFLCLVKYITQLH